jgi:hypothetical protein
MSRITNDDPVDNVFLATLEVYELHETIEFNYHGPKVVPKNKTPETICMINTIGIIWSRHLFHGLLDSGPSCCLIKKIIFTTRSHP